MPNTSKRSEAAEPPPAPEYPSLHRAGNSNSKAGIAALLVITRHIQLPQNPNKSLTIFIQRYLCRGQASGTCRQQVDNKRMLLRFVRQAPNAHPPSDAVSGGMMRIHLNPDGGTSAAFLPERRLHSRCVIIWKIFFRPCAHTGRKTISCTAQSRAPHPPPLPLRLELTYFVYEVVDAFFIFYGNFMRLFRSLVD